MGLDWAAAAQQKPRRGRLEDAVWSAKKKKYGLEDAVWIDVRRASEDASAVGLTQRGRG